MVPVALRPLALGADEGALLISNDGVRPPAEADL